jgi:Arc/MetJ family transcription regulator
VKKLQSTHVAVAISRLSAYGEALRALEVIQHEIGVRSGILNDQDADDWETLKLDLSGEVFDLGRLVNIEGDAGEILHAWVRVELGILEAVRDLLIGNKGTHRLELEDVGIHIDGPTAPRTTLTDQQRAARCIEATPCDVYDVYENTLRGSMRTNIDLDDALVDEAMKLSGAKTKKEVVDLALRALIKSKQRKDLLELVGHVTVPDDYDYKALRAGRARDD